MGTKMKGIYKGFKYTLTNMFVVKEEPEMEIGGPTDVKHVAHIGWDGPSGSGSAPAWMNEFKTGSDFAAASMCHTGSALSPWSSQDFGTSMSQQSGMFNDMPPTDLPPMKKKPRRKKNRSASSPKSSSSARSTRSEAKSKSHFSDGGAKSAIEVEVA